MHCVDRHVFLHSALQRNTPCAGVTQSRRADAEVQRGVKEEEPFTRCFPYSTLTYMPRQDLSEYCMNECFL